MGTLLRIAACASLAWALLLLALGSRALGFEELTPVTRGLANALALSHLALAYCFWYGARDPLANRGAIYTAILFMALKMLNDIHDLLVLLPARHAMISLADLVLSVGLLVGLLESLPRLFGRGRRN
jgi:hypothetical protein